MRSIYQQHLIFFLISILIISLSQLTLSCNLPIVQSKDIIGFVQVSEPTDKDIFLFPGTLENYAIFDFSMNAKNETYLVTFKLERFLNGERDENEWCHKTSVSDAGNIVIDFTFNLEYEDTMILDLFIVEDSVVTSSEYTQMFLNESDYQTLSSYNSKMHIREGEPIILTTTVSQLKDGIDDVGVCSTVFNGYESVKQELISSYNQVYIFSVVYTKDITYSPID